MFGKHWILVFIWPQTCASEVWTQQKAGSESLLALRVLAAPTIPLTGEPPHTRIPPDEKRANKHQRPWRAQSEPMKSSLLSRYTDMKGSMSAERERQVQGELNEGPIQKKKVSFPLCPKQELPERRLGKFAWRLMHIFYWLVLSTSDQSGPEGDYVLMCNRAYALFLERTSQGALDSRRLQNPSRLRSAARGEGRAPQDALFTFRS